MKIKLILLLIVLSNCKSIAQKAIVNENAIAILDNMSSFIGDLSSCSFTLNSSYDIKDNDLGLLKKFAVSQINFTGPDHFQADLKSDKGHKGYWYDGQQVAYYSYSENNYGYVDAPDNIIDAIDMLNNDYAVDFPASDFFYPTFTDDLINSSSKIDYLGNVNVNGIDCFHIACKGSTMDLQFWISNDAMFLPVKYLINYTNDKAHVGQYQGDFSNWKINPSLPNALYTFIPPSNANILRIVPNTKK